MRSHVGPWRDESREALLAALAEVNVSVEEYVEVYYSEGMRLAPVDETRSEIDVELHYSESRQQWRATLRQEGR